MYAYIYTRTQTYINLSHGPKHSDTDEVAILGHPEILTFDLVGSFMGPGKGVMLVLVVEEVVVVVETSFSKTHAFYLTQSIWVNWGKRLFQLLT